MTRESRITIAALAALLFGAGTGRTQDLSAQERVAALKATLASSQESLRQYEWIETTVVSLKGEEKSRQQNRCYYGADGKLQKVPVSAAPPPATKRGLRGRIVEAKKEELTDTMKQAVALVHQYVPPDPARIEAVKTAGGLTIQPLGQTARLAFASYLKPGDGLSVEIDLATNRLAGIKVASYLGSPSDAISLDVGMSTLADGASYAATTRLDAPAQKLSVTIENSGYRKSTP